MYIYSKNSGHCIILNSQESLIYPFNFGFWQEIRMGGFFSVVSGGTGWNSNFPGFTGNMSGPLTQLYIGFKDSGSALPGEKNTTFVGIGRQANNSASSAITSSTLCFGAPGSTANMAGYYQTFDTNGNVVYYNANTQNSMSITNPTPDTNFASFWGLTLQIQGNFFSGMSIYDTAFYTDVSTGNLSRLVNAPPSVSSFVTGYFTTGGANSNNTLILPQAVYIYFPFPNNQLRIHSLDIEQYN